MNICENTKTIVADGNVRVTYQENFLNKCESQNLFDSLLSKTDWTIDKHNTKPNFDTPRKVGCYTTVRGMKYEFSGNTRAPQLWIDELKPVWQKVEKAVGHEFNFVLLNLYEHGNHSLGWHSDQANNLVQDSSIASISLTPTGSERVFDLKRRHDKNANTISTILRNGSLLVMNYETQEHYIHRIPKAKNVGRRINLTFRLLKDYEVSSNSGV